MARGTGGTIVHRTSLRPRGSTVPGVVVEPRTFPPALREAILARDGHQCCLRALGGCRGPLHIDHFVPQTLGGRTVFGNGWTLCGFHNGAKSGRMPSAEMREAWIASGRPLPWS